MSQDKPVKLTRRQRNTLPSPLTLLDQYAYRNGPHVMLKTEVQSLTSEPCFIYHKWNKDLLKWELVDG